MSGSSEVRVGLEREPEAYPEVIRRGRFGLLMNQASVDDDLRGAHEVLAARHPGQLVALFSPQHGFWSEQQDNMIESAHGRESGLGVPIWSLYGEKREPTPQMLAPLDALVIDLQDVGVRAYTFLWTLAACLEACAAAGVPVVVLDRPNPLGGEVLEGALLEPGFESFVGRLPWPMRHGLTLGEAARALVRELPCEVELQVVPMSGWRRSMLWPETGRLWIGPSPNLPRWESLVSYPGQLLIEGTQLSEGRGTTTPFEVFGAPWVDGKRLRSFLIDAGHDPRSLRAIRFEPTFEKLAGLSCGGLHIHPRDDGAHRSYRLTLDALRGLRALWPEHFRWREPPFEYEEVLAPIDILSGSDRLRSAVDSFAPAEVFDLLAQADAEAWWTARAPDLLY